MKDLVIIGAGPAGLRMAHEAEQEKLNYIVLEKGKIGQAWKEVRPNMTMLSPSHPQRDWTSLSADFPIWKMDVERPFCSASEFTEYLDAYAKHFRLQIRTDAKVTDIEQTSQGFRISLNGETIDSKMLVVATGFFGNPYIPEIPGFANNPIVSHSHHYANSRVFRGKRVVVIGGGNSAAEIVLELAGFSQTYLITRNELKFFSQTGNLCHIRGLSESLLRELIKMGLIRSMPAAEIEKLDGNKLHVNGKSIPVDHVLCATGYRADLCLLKSLPVSLHPSTYFPMIYPSGESRDVPGLFFAGPLAYRRVGSMFIHGFIKHIPETFKHLVGKLQ
jgi:thioredoxin reductase